MEVQAVEDDAPFVNLVTSILDPERETKDSANHKVDYNKLERYHRLHTEEMANALETLISQSHGDMSEFRKSLDAAREFLGRYHGPMIWLTFDEAQRYANEQNARIRPENGRERYQVRSENGHFLVLHPIQ